VSTLSVTSIYVRCLKRTFAHKATLGSSPAGHDIALSDESDVEGGITLAVVLRPTRPSKGSTSKWISMKKTTYLETYFYGFNVHFMKCAFCYQIFKGYIKAVSC